MRHSRTCIQEACLTIRMNQCLECFAILNGKLISPDASCSCPGLVICTCDTVSSCSWGKCHNWVLGQVRHLRTPGPSSEDVFSITIQAAPREVRLLPLADDLSFLFCPALCCPNLDHLIVHTVLWNLAASWPPQYWKLSEFDFLIKVQDVEAQHWICYKNNHGGEDHDAVPAAWCLFSQSQTGRCIDFGLDCSCVYFTLSHARPSILAPCRYQDDDQPWMADVPFKGSDSHGRHISEPRSSLYGHLQDWSSVCQSWSG